jgi:hypothetical protein
VLSNVLEDDIDSAAATAAAVIMSTNGEVDNDEEQDKE